MIHHRVSTTRVVLLHMDIARDKMITLRASPRDKERTGHKNNNAVQREPACLYCNSDGTDSRHPFSKARQQHPKTVIQPCMWSLHDEAGYTLCCLAQGELTRLFHEPHTGAGFNGRVNGFTHVDSACPIVDQ